MNISTLFVTMKPKSMIPFLLCAALLFSCQKPADLIVTQEPARTMHIDHADEGLARIAEDARNTLPGFFWHLARARAGEKSFCVKYPLPAGYEGGFGTAGGVGAAEGIVMEQVWLTGIYFKDGLYYGLLADAPMHLGGLQKGDRVVFETDDVTDWMYVRNGRIIGGLSVKYLLEKIPEDQRSAGEQNLLQMFE